MAQTRLDPRHEPPAAAPPPVSTGRAGGARVAKGSLGARGQVAGRWWVGAGWGRRLGTVLVVLVIATAALLGGVLLRPGSGRDGAAPVDVGRHAAPDPVGAGRPDDPAVGLSGDLAAGIARAQRHLASVPGDWPTWAELGAAYVQQARLTADPSYYPKAEGALRRSLAEHPRGNHLALIGLGALAAGRHDFAGALRYGREALAIDPYSAPAQGVVADALVELGRYPEAWVAVQRMVDLRPDTGSLSRGSYTAELRGDIATARALLSGALDLAPSPADAGYALYYLGELAWNSGDLAGARARWQEGLRRAPGYLPLLVGTARLAAADGRYADAVAAYRDLVNRLPQPAYLIEYADLLAVHGDTAGAAGQYAVVRTEERLFAAQGVNVDLEVALFDADHGSPARALAEARAAYRQRRSVAVEDALAWVLYRNGRAAEALPHARAALRLGTRSAPFRYHLGMIELVLGDRAAARAGLSEALRLNPYFSWLQAPRARAALAALGGAR
jgi:tetratricopeptide (TPR) repeat protein